MVAKPHDPVTIIRRFDQLKAERALWETLWQEVADLVCPTMDFNRNTIRGEERRNKQYHPAGPYSADLLASALHTLIMNPATQWLSLAPADTLPVDDEGARWLQDRAMNLLNFYSSPKSGFNVTSIETFSSLVSFGTAPFVRHSRPGQMPRYYSLPLSNTYMGGDEYGEVVEVYRDIYYDPLDAYKQFGDKLSDESMKCVKDAEAGKNPDKKIRVHHAIFLTDRQYAKGGSPFDKPWASVYVERDQKVLLRQGGFDENPIKTPRWKRNPGEVYGRSPAMQAMPFIKLVNVMSRDTITAGQLKVRPPVNVPANNIIDGNNGRYRVEPGAINYYQMGTRDKAEALDTGADPSAGMLMIEHAVQIIREIFYNDLLRLPEQDRMTALEVSVRSNQKMTAMSPVLARILQEQVDPAVKSDYEYMRGNNMFPDAPQSLRGREFKIDYRSPMAIAQHASQANNLLQLMGVSAPLLQADPSIMQDIDGRETFRSLAQTLNATVLKFRDKEQVDRQREQERQAQLQSAGAATAKDLAGAGKDAAAAVSTIAESQGLRLAN